MNQQLIDRLAREAGGVLESWASNPPRPAQWHFTPEQFVKYTNLVLEECFNNCEAAICEENIRAAFHLPEAGK